MSNKCLRDYTNRDVLVEHNSDLGSCQKEKVNDIATSLSTTPAADLRFATILLVVNENIPALLLNLNMSSLSNGKRGPVRIELPTESLLGRTAESQGFLSSMCLCVDKEPRDISMLPGL